MKQNLGTGITSKWWDVEVIRAKGYWGLMGPITTGLPTYNFALTLDGLIRPIRTCIETEEALDASPTGTHVCSLTESRNPL